MHTLIDIGANLTHDSFDADRDEVIARAAAVGVTRMIVTGASADGGNGVSSLGWCQRARRLVQNGHSVTRGGPKSTFQAARTLDTPKRYANVCAFPGRKSYVRWYAGSEACSGVAQW